MREISGVGVALVTPFDISGNVDYDGLSKLLVHTKCVDYWVVMGTTGESATTTKDEKQQVLSYILKNNPDNKPIIYGIGGNNTHQVIEEIKGTDLTDVDAILSVCPAYNKPTQNGMIAHFTAIADASPIPVLLYNVPGRTIVNLNASSTLKLAKHPNIMGIKEASNNLLQGTAIAHDKPNDFKLISGDDMLSVPLIAMGGCGLISVLANAYPNEFKEIIDSAKSGNFTSAANIASKFLGLNTLMYEESNPVGVKHVLNKMGVCTNEVRLPMLSASNELQAKIEEEMTKI